MKSRVTAMLFAVLVLKLPILELFATVIIGLATLSIAPIEGLLIWAVVTTAYAFFISGHELMMPLAVLFGGMNLTVWGLCAILATTRSWKMVLEAAALLAMVLYSLLLCFDGQLCAWLCEFYLRTLTELQAMESGSVFIVWKAMLLNYGAAIIAFTVMLQGILLTILSRFSHALLYRPGMFKAEFLALRMPNHWLVAITLVGMISIFTNYSIVPYLLILLVPLLVSGLSMFHYTVNEFSRSRLWILALYVLLLVRPEVMCLFLVCFAISDTIFDMRMHLKKIMV